MDNLIILVLVGLKRKVLSLIDRQVARLHRLVSLSENELRTLVFFVVFLGVRGAVVSIIVFKVCTKEEFYHCIKIK